jgi:hypothetical protein
MADYSPVLGVLACSMISDIGDATLTACQFAVYVELNTTPH